MRLIDRLKALFADEVASGNDPHSLELASAVLLFEVVWADHEIDDAEMKTLREALSRTLALSAEEIDELVRETRAQQDHHVGVYEFTRVVNEHCQPEEKYALVENLWRIAFADGVASSIEEHTIRRISELLYVPHRDFIRAKQSAGSSRTGRT